MDTSYKKELNQKLQIIGSSIINFEDKTNYNPKQPNFKGNTHIVLIEIFTYYPSINLGLNVFLFPINMSTFRSSPSKKTLQLLVPQKFSIFTFGPSFKVKSCLEFIFLNEILQKNS